MNKRKKTKIVTTIGPATANLPMMKSLINAGANAFRLNFSHGSHEDHLKVFDLARQAEKEENQPIAIIQDLCGPKIRIGDFNTESITLEKGQDFEIVTEKIVGDKNKVCISYENFIQEIKEGDKILLDDGKITLEAISKGKNSVKTKVISGGVIKGRRGVNLPDSSLSLSSMTEKDFSDLKFAKEKAVDFVALSFVRTEKDVLQLKEAMAREKIEARVISKIETKEALQNIDSIIAVSDAIMVARGDLAVEIGNENVPMAQKNIIKKCNYAGIPVITATQMLDSMVSISTPTRAEVSDVANAILDGTDALMLSQETAIGEYPVEAVKTMARVAHRVENDFHHREVVKHRFSKKEVDVSIADSITGSASELAETIKASFIVAVTESGFTARMVSRYHPEQPILALAPNIKTYRSLAISFGCYPVLISWIDNMDEAIKVSKEYFIKNGYGKVGDRVVLTTGIPFGHNSKTNTILVEIL